MIRPIATPPPLVRGRSRFRLRICFMGGGAKPFGWEVYDEEDGETVRRSVRRFRTSSEAWQAGSAVLDEQDISAGGNPGGPNTLR
jgi:hypothetical protein